MLAWSAGFSEDAMQFAYVTLPGRGSLDLLLSGLAARGLAQGWRLAGAVQENVERAGSEKCDMDLRVLPNGPVMRISQRLGSGAAGCTLDPTALETAVGEAGLRLTADSDLLIVNKFGRHESEGRGFREVIAQALELEVPVLVGLNPGYAEAFDSFCGGMAEQVAPTAAALEAWCRAAIDNRRQAA
ncbi:DUF2478 domain-containing protein [Mesobacterium sp. TK19101]|uniref:DUF2478 domain-containing protein n=1 Tax=Mesobacterium hydrothermale TaxID=3111907 RepID=A0ABU6HJG8_9RHOB|nr:DUF2478 domain-containing protein [Mesobacterium sp. TK19101]MEC3862603.1 DUF2478 domain-containing protein [Mesobacterium sp. TK19101]